MKGQKPQKVSAQTSNVVNNFPFQSLAHLHFSGLLTGALSPAFLPGLHNWPQK